MTVCAKQLWLYALKQTFMMELTNILGTFHVHVLYKYIVLYLKKFRYFCFLAKSHFYDQD